MPPPVILVIPARAEAESIVAVLSEVPPEVVGEVVVVGRMRPTWCSAVAMSRLTQMPARSTRALAIV
jgi:hypothetical protein